ncbi:aminotransferase class III-fold pyridoxal phosphate-dependent enzyme [soil metagenome]
MFFAAPPIEGTLAQEPSTTHSRERYKTFVNPFLGELLEALGLDKEFVRGAGCWLFDGAGRRYLDFIGGYGAVSFGHAPAFVDSAIASHLAAQSPALVQPSVLGPAARLAQRLVELTPAGLNYVCFTNSGAEAVEAAIKACRSSTGRPGVIYATGSFHGKTLGALSATGSPKYQEPFFAPAPDFSAVPYGELLALEETLKAQADHTACVILEPIQGEGGIVVPHVGYLSGVRKLCDQYGVLLILDEVQTGLGRTGILFACELEGVSPDCMTLSKALGAGIIPIGCCLLNDKAYSKTFAMFHSSTFAGNGLACSVALAALNALCDPQAALLENVAARGEQLIVGLRSLAERYPSVVRSVRGRGLLLGVELTFSREFARRSFGATLEAMSDQGCLVPLISSYLLNVEGVRTAPTLTSGSVLRIEPPLVVSAEQCDEFLAAMARVLELLARGDTGSLLDHLVRMSSNEQPMHAAAEPLEVLVGTLPRPQPQDSRVAFLIHTLDARTMMEFDSSLQRFSEPALRRAARLAELFLKPFVSARTRVVSGGASVYCEFISIPRLSESLLALSADEAEVEVAAAVELARDRGARLVGLGAYTSVVTQGGTRVTKYGVPVTTGNTYTVITALLGVEYAAAQTGLPLSRAHMVVIGTTGMIGSSLVDAFLGRTARLTLIGNPARPDTTRRRMISHLCATLKGEVHGDTEREDWFAADLQAGELLRQGQYEELARKLVDHETALPFVCDLDAHDYLADADIVICATSSTEYLVDVTKLKQGCLVLDLSRPSNVDRAALDARPDVLFIDGGVVAFPNAPDLGFDFGFPLGNGFACMAETIMLGMAGRFAHCSVGIRIDRDTRDMIAGLAKRFGFRLAGLRRFNRNMDEVDWRSYLDGRAVANASQMTRIA